MLKKELRRQLLAQYRSVAPCDLSDAVRRLPAYQQARSVALYYAAGFEVSVSDLLGDTDKILLLPRCQESGMVFCRYDGMLTSDRFGIPAPTERWQGDIDLMLVPALAYDRQGGRLGRGGGFYDRALADYAGTSIGVIREAFLLDRVPMERHDKKVSSVLTEKGVYTFL